MFSKLWDHNEKDQLTCVACKRSASSVVACARRAQTTRFHTKEVHADFATDRFFIISQVDNKQAVNPKAAASI